MPSQCKPPELTERIPIEDFAKRLRENPTKGEKFALMATGEEIPNGYQYCDSVLVEAGKFVWHLYEVIA